MATDSGDTLFTSSHQRWHRRLTISTILIAICVQVLDQPLKTQHAPLGIVSLQLAGSVRAAKQIVYDWTPQDRLAAAFGLGFDNLFLTSYSIWLCLGCRWAAERFREANPSRSNLLALLSWGAILAGLLDVVENVILLIFLQSDGKSVLYPLAFWCAAVKFGLLLLVIIGWISGTRAPRDAVAKPATGKKS